MLLQKLLVAGISGAIVGCLTSSLVTVMQDLNITEDRIKDRYAVMYELDDTLILYDPAEDVMLTKDDYMKGVLTWKEK